MDGIFADRNKATPIDKSDMNAFPTCLRGMHLNTTTKPLCGRAAIQAFDKQASPRNQINSPNAAGLPSVTASEPAVQNGHDESLFAHKGIVHDTRNILQVLLSGVWAAQNRIQVGRAHEVPEILGEISEAVDRANALLRQLQRIPSSSEKRKSAVDIGKMLTRLNTSLSWALGASNELVIAVAPDLPAIYCLEDELENVVLNFVINARDAMPTGGRVTIEAIRGARSSVVLRVHDTGVGMDIDVAAKAFDPYFTTKSSATGTGMGLAKVAAFARSIKGSARIEHTSASGTTMALYLPITLRAN
jgi:signal transduction histidine kinase